MGAGAWGSPECDHQEGTSARSPDPRRAPQRADMRAIVDIVEKQRSYLPWPSTPRALRGNPPRWLVLPSPLDGRDSVTTDRVLALRVRQSGPAEDPGRHQLGRPSTASARSFAGTAATSASPGQVAIFDRPLVYVPLDNSLPEADLDRAVVELGARTLRSLIVRREPSSGHGSVVSWQPHGNNTRRLIAALDTLYWKILRRRFALLAAATSRVVTLRLAARARGSRRRGDRAARCEHGSTSIGVV